VATSLEPDGRVEAACSKCGGHLGHVFDNEDSYPSTNQRHCINDSSIQYVAFDPPAGAAEAGRLELPSAPP